MLKILIHTDTRYPVNRKKVRAAIVDKLKEFKISSDVELSVSVVGSRKMQSLCQKYLADSEVHDVLSFPFLDFLKKSEGFVEYPDKVLRLGDIVLCWPEVLLAAAADGVMVDDEVYLLTSHSVEHLLGKHHE